MTEYPTADALIAGPLGAWLQEQVAVRAEAQRRSGTRLFRVLIVLLPALAFFFVLTDVDWDFKLMLAFAAISVGYGWSQAPTRAAVKAVKGGINGALAGSLGLTYHQECEAGEEFTTAETYGLLPDYDRKSAEDRWQGEVSGHQFALHEMHLEEQRGSGKNRHWVTVFRGSIIRIAFAEQFHGTTIVARAGKFRRFFGGRKDSIEVGGLTLDVAEMVHPQFEDVFDIYTNDQTEARWIIHPEYIERLIGIEQAFDGEDIAALFSGGSLIIALKCGNLFESGSIDPTEDRAKLAETISQFQRLADLALALNTIRPDRHGAHSA